MARILLAEDDFSIQLLVKENLKDRFTILTANNGLEALELIENGQVDLLITDIMMPVIDGIQLVQETRKLNQHLPIIMLTAKSAISDKKESFSQGADDYLTKPIDFEELDMRITALMRRAGVSINRTLHFGDTSLDQLSYTVCWKEQVLELPKKEFDLLFKLLSYPKSDFHTKSVAR
ncbi:response regulator transcription factor [Streptococcus suis]|uniref:response regulator transcription factor n=1 Tax=Streptococcus suis TaxID=1307 RepID=UPI000400BBE6|nr:response regulator transcription factor [Streptococcus suis]